MKIELEITVIHQLGADSASVGELVTLLRNLLADAQVVRGQIQESEARLMSELSDKLNAAVGKLETAIDGMTTRHRDEVAAQEAVIADLRAQLAAGGMSPAETAAVEARLAAAVTRLDQIDPTTGSTLPVEPAPLAPEPAPAPAPEPVTPVEPAPAEPPPLPPTP